ncbi:MAG: hypothetical protein WA421_16695 [Nitrososphaeraceae archaeon]
MSQKQTIDIVVPPIEGGMKEMAMPTYKQVSCYHTLIGKISLEIGLAKTMKMWIFVISDPLYKKRLHPLYILDEQ